MRPLHKYVAVLGAVGIGLAGAWQMGPRAGIDDPGVRDILSGIDFVPPKSTLDLVLGVQAEGDLVIIARNVDSTNDPGVRIRAYRALRHYPSEDVRAALASALAEHGVRDGLETLYTAAAAEALALVDGAGAVADIAPLLDHPRRDVRVAAARALGTTGAADAVPYLRTRALVEDVDQVLLAINAAIRDLTGAPTPD